jgi:hypothetical protein
MVPEENTVMTTTVARIFAVLFLLLLAPRGSAAEPAAADLEAGFRSPPASARPWVYWFWLNGNITREGITADLEAMARVGIGGVLIMEVDQGAPLGPVGFMSAKWRELFRHVVAEAGRLGLEVNMNDDAGWNGSGGPWIAPERSMKKVVWTETAVEGPKRFEGALLQPKAVARLYRDIAVLAFPTPGAFRIENIGAKAAYGVGGVGMPETKVAPPGSAIERDRIVDLTAKMDSAGRIAWDVPAGSWMVLRFGFTGTGAENAPSPASGRGLECDKLSREGIEAAFDGMMAKLIDDVGPGAGRDLVATHIDSWENGSQNWTDRMREEFRARRGYDILPFLPAYTGRVVGSLETTERFLWDLRRTVSDLVVENYAGRMRELAKAKGLRLTIEAYGGPCDVLPYGGRADEPMGEFWMGGGAMETCRGMASAGHVYGKPIIGAEAFTAGDGERWRDHPASIKSLGDRAFCEGINRFVFHRYALQPWTVDRRPGMTMGPWGLHYERTETWWEKSPDWHRYLARCQLLLRQGLYVADICFLQPETPPQGFGDHPRQGYGWDECPAEVVLERMAAKDGRIVLPDGMSYAVLVLPEARAMTPALLAKVEALVREGATVLGPPPLRSPSLSGHPACDEEVRRIAAALWGDVDGAKVKERAHGRGRVAWGYSPEALLARMGVRPDFESAGRLRSIHRRSPGADIYFVANPHPRAVTGTATFRVTGKVPELWWPDSGRIERAALHEEKDGATTVLLPLEASGSVFVVFREAAAGIDPVVTVTRDGSPLLSAERKPAPKIVVRKATYGVPGDAARTRDVRDLAQGKADAGETLFPVTEMAAGGDPAPNVAKTLIIEYSVEKEEFKVQAKDGEVIGLKTSAVAAVVEKATYGVLGDPARTRDVKARVQKILDAGEASFQVARLAAGDDPAFGTVKTVIVEYSIGGRRLTATGTDPEWIDLSPLALEAADVEIGIGQGGEVLLQASRPGRYELRTASGRTSKIDLPDAPPPLAVPGPWELRFPAGERAPERVTLDGLASWTENAEDGVRHFSGTGTYRTSFRVPSGFRSGSRRLVLDLGEVREIAEAKLNGRDLGVLWKAPFRADVTEILRDGENELEVRVTNLWPNRMVGDELLREDSERNPDGTLKAWPRWLEEGKPSPAGRRTFTSWRLWKKGDALLRSGLIGPVAIRAVERREIR